MDQRRVHRWAAWTLLAFGLVCLTVAIVNLSQDVSLWVLGRRTTARVIDAWVEQGGENPDPTTFQYFVRYEFTGLDGKIVHGEARVGAQEWASLGLGRRLLRTI
jgi:hypothetical protein